MKQLLILILLCTLPCPLLAEERPTILIDQSHRQMFMIDQETSLGLSKLATLLNKEGYQLSIQNSALTRDALNGKAILLSSGPFLPFQKAELDDTLAYLTEGGSLLMMLHIAPPVKKLLFSLGVAYSNGVIHEQEQTIEDQDLNFNVTNFTNHPITKKLGQFEAYGAWALLPMKGEIGTVASTGPKAWVDLDGSKSLTEKDIVQELGVVVAGTYGKGRFVIFGDDAIFQNQFLSENNRQLMINSLAWLRGE